MFERMMAALEAMEGKLHRTGTYYYVDAELRELRAVADGLKPQIGARLVPRDPEIGARLVPRDPVVTPVPETIAVDPEAAEIAAKAAALGITEETDVVSA